MLITITIIATIAMIVAPSLTDDTRLRLMSASGVLISDIELAQVMTISHPDEPIVVRFDPTKDEYWLAYADTPATPMLRADNGEPYRLKLGEGRMLTAGTATLTVSDMTANTLEFNAQGGLEDFSATPQITISLDGEWVRLDVAPTTGSVTETFGSS
jgi:Tfp pilus assembly protein FimT